MKKRFLQALVLTSLAAPAQAEVKSSGPGHFEVESRGGVHATPAEAYAMLGRISEWWNADHSYSGDASNLRLSLQAGGCFCELLPQEGGSVEHMRVVYARPGATLRLQGGLGPLQAEAVTGTLSWSFKPVEGGTEIVQNYAVAGHVRVGMEKLAGPVDKVMDEQFSRLRDRLNGPPAQISR
jgi:hypothetical protein